MTDLDELKVLFVAGFGPIVTDPEASQALYLGALKLPLQAQPDDPHYFHTESLDGVRHFAMWPLAGAAQSCFGTDRWPKKVPTPQGWIEFEVENVNTASAVLKRLGYSLLVDTRKEPWGQTVARLLSPEGLLVGVTLTPSLRHSRK